MAATAQAGVLLLREVAEVIRQPEASQGCALRPKLSHGSAHAGNLKPGLTQRTFLKLSQA